MASRVKGLTPEQEADLASLVEAHVVDEMERTPHTAQVKIAWRNKGGNVLTAADLDKVRKQAHLAAKKRNAADLAEVESRSLLVVSERIAMLAEERNISLEEAKAIVLGHKTTDDNFYALQSICAGEASNVRRVQISTIDPHVLEGREEDNLSREDKRFQNRLQLAERELGAKLGRESAFGQVGPDDRFGADRVDAYLASDSREIIKPDHLIKGVGTVAIARAAHDTTIMDPSDVRFIRELEAAYWRVALVHAETVLKQDMRAENAGYRAILAKMDEVDMQSATDILNEYFPFRKEQDDHPEPDNWPKPDCFLELLFDTYKGQKERIKAIRKEVASVPMFPGRDDQPKVTIEVHNTNGGQDAPKVIQRSFQLPKHREADLDKGRSGDVIAKRRVIYAVVAQILNEDESRIKRLSKKLAGLAQQTFQWLELHDVGRLERQREIARFEQDWEDWAYDALPVYTGTTPILPQEGQVGRNLVEAAKQRNADNPPTVTEIVTGFPKRYQTFFERKARDEGISVDEAATRHYATL